MIAYGTENTDQREKGNVIASPPDRTGSEVRRSNLMTVSGISEEIASLAMTKRKPRINTTTVMQGIAV